MTIELAIDIFILIGLAFCVALMRATSRLSKTRHDETVAVLATLNNQAASFNRRISALEKDRSKTKEGT
jgi:hypothetical protein